jgi:hypothetical protein
MGRRGGKADGYRMGGGWGAEWETDCVQYGRQIGYRIGDRWGTEGETDGVQNRRQNAGNEGKDREIRRRTYCVSRMRDRIETLTED